MVLFGVAKRCSISLSASGSFGLSVGQNVDILTVNTDAYFARVSLGKVTFERILMLFDLKPQMLSFDVSPSDRFGVSLGRHCWTFGYLLIGPC